jgi:ABC-2 type transport system ATP-binding protein
MDDIAIKVEHVSKTFNLPHERQDSVKGALIGLVKGADRTFERQEVLRDISFEVKQGEFFGIVGRNGSGKSTLLKILAGIYVPTKGNVYVNGKLTPFIELGVGFNHELTGRENVYLNGALLGFNRKEMDAMYDEIVTFAELEKFMDQKLKNYSSGMQVRLAFSIAIRAQTQILIMDEVLAVGDAAFQKKCFDIFRDLKNQGRTIVLVTHDMSNVERFCDRVLVIHNGNTLALTTPQEASSLYAQINIEESKSSITTERAVRWGVGGIKVKKVDIVDSRNSPVNFIKVGKTLRIRIELERNNAHKTTPIVCGMAIYNQDGINLTGPNSTRTPIKDGANEIVASIPNFRFASGEYSLTIVIYNQEVTEPYDFLDRYKKFSVLADHTIHGLVEVESEWTSR